MKQLRGDEAIESSKRIDMIKGIAWRPECFDAFSIKQAQVLIIYLATELTDVSTNTAM